MPTLGVSVTIPPPWGEFLQSKRASYGDPQALAIPPHVTLLPPTEVGEAELAGFEEHLRAVARQTSPFRMVLRGTGTFRPTSPVVFVTVAQGIPSCERLEKAVRSGPVERALDFPYHPHVTVAHHLDDAGLDLAFEDLADFRADFVVDHIDLFDQNGDGVWHPRVGFALGSGG